MRKFKGKYGTEEALESIEKDSAFMNIKKKRIYHHY